MSDMILLGAGASIDAGIPGAYAMTQKMIEIIEGHDYYHEYARVLNFVAAGLIFKYGSEGRNPFKGLNVEELFTAIKLLSDRDNLEITPFINAWSPYINAIESKFSEPSSFDFDELLDSIYEPLRGHAFGTGDPIIRNLHNIVNYRVTSSWDFERRFTDVVSRIAFGKHSSVFERTLNVMISVLKDIVWVNDYSKLNYLDPLIDYCHRTSVCFASLNYDNAIELVGKTKQVKIDTGIEEWSKNNEFKFASDSTPLIKIHGSINWNLQDISENYDVLMPKQVMKIEEINPDPNDENNFSPAVIFGGSNKLTAKGPFLDLLRIFRQKLFESNRLTIIGYSFRDDHVNEYISQWINNIPDFKMIIIDPEFQNYQGDYYDRLRELARDGRAIIMEQKAKVVIPELITLLNAKE